MSEQSTGTDIDKNFRVADSLTARQKLLNIDIEDSSELAPKNEEIAEIFRRNRLLARAMTPLHFERQDDGSFAHSFSVWDEELDMMEDGEMKYTSCTLLVPSEKVPTYKTYGLLMDGDQSDIVHLAETDSGSSRGIGDFRANASDIDNLDQLAEAIKVHKTGNMNEVNAHFPINSVKGLFVVDAPKPNGKLELLITKKHLEGRGMDLPMYIYSQKKGTIEPWEPTDGDVLELISAVASPNHKEIYMRELSLI